jgi:hypothetical protein
VIRKSAQATERARRKIMPKSQQGGPTPKPDTLRYADYVMVFTTLPREAFSAAEIAQWYRTRWQIELVFKQLKSLAQLGTCPNMTTAVRAPGVNPASFFTRFNKPSNQLFPDPGARPTGTRSPPISPHPLASAGFSLIIVNR